MAKYKVTNENKARIVKRLKENGVSYWEIAEVLDLHENTVSKWLRKPTDEQTAQIMQAILKVVEHREAAATVEQ